MNSDSEDANELGSRLDFFFERDANEVVNDAKRILGEGGDPRLSALSLSKQAAEVSWRLMQTRETPEPSAQATTLRMASALCDAIDAADALVTGGELTSPSTETLLGVSTRRMLVSQRASLAPTLLAVKGGLGKIRSIIDTVGGSSHRSPDTEIAKLQRYFACLATVLQEVAL